MSDDEAPTTGQPKKYLTYSEKFANYVADMEDAERLIQVFNDFRKAQTDEKKEVSDTLTFGKYKFKTVAEVAAFDKKYLVWLRKQSNMSAYPKLLAEIDKHIKK